MGWLVLALACYRQGKKKEAAEWYRKATEPLRGEGRQRIRVEDWVAAHLLLREAELALTTGKTATGRESEKGG